MSFTATRNIFFPKDLANSKSISNSVSLLAWAIKFDLNNFTSNKFFGHKSYSRLMLSRSIFLNTSEATRQFCYDYLDAVQVTFIQGGIRLEYTFDAKYYLQREYPGSSEDQKAYEAKVIQSGQLAEIDKLFVQSFYKELGLTITPAPAVNKKDNVPVASVRAPTKKPASPILKDLSAHSVGIANESDSDDSDVEDLDVDLLRRPVPIHNSASVAVVGAPVEEVHAVSPSTPEPMSFDDEPMRPKASDFSPERNGIARCVQSEFNISSIRHSLGSSYGGIWRTVESTDTSVELACSVDNTVESPGSVIDLGSPTLV